MSDLRFTIYDLRLLMDDRRFTETAGEVCMKDGVARHIATAGRDNHEQA